MKTYGYGISPRGTRRHHKARMKRKLSWIEFRSAR